MMVTLLGAAISDGLEDGRVVSGVGGQFDFVRMAHALDDGRSVLMFGSRRLKNGAASSNIVWKYGHTTVPRHCRDVFANEYGLAATRGLPDQAIVASLLDIADSTFQDPLLREAVAAGKINSSYRIPESARINTASRLHEVFEDFRVKAHFPEYPLGTDLTPIEQDLLRALESLEEMTGSRWSRVATIGAAFKPRRSNGHPAALERLGLDSPGTLRERLLRRLVLYVLDKTAPAG